MKLAKRIFLFLTLNILVILMITLVLNLFNIQPYLTSVGFDYKSLLIFCFIWGMVGALISLSLSRIMAKWMMGVKLVSVDTKDPDQIALLEIVRRLTKKAHLPMPQVGIYKSNEVNAFATGPSRFRSLIAVSTGLLQRMKNEEMEAVLAHEVTHIANGDMVTMTLLQGVVNAFVMFLARVLAYAVSGLGRNRQEGEGGSYMSYIVFVYLFEIVFMVLGSLVIAAYSRFREFRADAGGARLAGKDAMIAALQTLRVFQEVHDKQAENPAIAAFKISHSGKKSTWLALFATHPPLEERIARLHRSN